MKRFSRFLGWSLAAIIALHCFADAASAAVPYYLLYPQIEGEISARVMSLGGCSVSQSGRAEQIFFNPAGLWQHQQNTRGYFDLFNRFESTKSELIKPTSETALAGSLGWKIRRISLIGAAGYYDQGLSLPSLSLGDYNAPIEESDVKYSDRNIVIGGAAATGNDTVQVWSFGVAYHLLETDFGIRTGVGRVADVGFNWELAPKRKNVLIMAGMGAAYRRYFSKQWSYPRFVDAPENHSFRIGYHIGSNTFFQPVWFTEFEFEHNKGTELRFRRASVGIQLKPVATDESSEFGFISVAVRGGMLMRRWLIPSNLGGKETGIDYSLRTGMGIDAAFRSYQLTLDAGYVVTEWGGDYLPSFSEKLYGGRWMITTNLSSRRSTPALWKFE